MWIDLDLVAYLAVLAVLLLIGLATLRDGAKDPPSDADLDAILFQDEPRYQEDDNER